MYNISKCGLIVHAFATASLACPLCHTETGEKVRSGIFGPDFGFNLLIVFLPFAICLGMTALIYFGVPGADRRGETS